MFSRAYYWFRKIPIYRVEHQPNSVPYCYKIYRRVRGEGSEFTMAKETLEDALEAIDRFRYRDRQTMKANDALSRNRVPGEFNPVETVSLFEVIFTVANQLQKYNRER